MMEGGMKASKRMMLYDRLRVTNCMSACMSTCKYTGL